MSLEQAGVTSKSAPRPTDLSAWVGLMLPRPGAAAQGPAPAPAPAPGLAPALAPVASHMASSAAVPVRSAPPATFRRRESYDDDQDEISQQLLMSQGHRPPSSISPPTSQTSQTRNGYGISLGRSASPVHHAARYSPSRPHGAATPSLANPRPTSQSHVSRSQQPGVASSLAMEIDELANSGGDEESYVLPLVMSDLDPRYRKTATPPPPPPEKLPTKSTQSALPPSLSLRQPSPHKTNGIGNSSSVAPVPQPVVTIPINSLAPTTHQPKSSTPRQEAPMTVSVSLPSLYTPKKYERTDSTGATQMTGTTETLHASVQTKSPIVAVGRRSRPKPDVRIKGGRPKGWKPGMSYREVALRNAGVDPNDPSLPPEVLLPPRARKQGRPPGRPRLPGRPKVKVKPSQSLGYKRIGRPPIQSIDAVQRSIFDAGQACFAPFMCEWAGCRAELQNMATLRRHVAFVHGRPSSAVKTCQWRRCANRVPAVQYKDEADTDADGRTFLEHMDYQHLAPLLWHRGDGFANTGHIGPPPTPAAAALLTKTRARDEMKPKTEDGNKSRTLMSSMAPMDKGASANTAPEIPLDGIPMADLPRYLLDDKGKQVTPLLRDTVLEASPIFWTQEERERRLKDLYRQQQQNLNKRPVRSLGRVI